MLAERCCLVVLSLSLSLSAIAQFEQGPPLPRKASLGAQLVAVNAEKAKALKLGAALVEVVRVIPGTTAEALRLLPGDVILSLNGTKITTVPEVMAQMRSVMGSQPISAKIVRDGKNFELTGTAIEKPKQKGDGFTVQYSQVLSQGKRIRVIATHPNGPGPYPTIFMIGGIGSYSMDGEYGAISYGNILGQFAKDYAIIRTDKPGQGDSEGPPYAELLFDTELDAYLQSMRLTKSFPFVDKNRIAIFGHSMGGVFGPLVAQTEKVAGLAVSGTISKTWMEYILENTRRQSILGGAQAEAVDKEIFDLAAVSQHLFYEDMSTKEIIRKYPKLKEAVNAQIPDGKTYSGVGLGFWQQLAKKNMPAAWLKTNTKVLALWGSTDFISTQWDHEYIANIINQKTPSSAEYFVVPNSDHGFSNTATMKESMEKWGTGKAAFNPNIVEILRAWFKRTIG